MRWTKLKKLLEERFCTQLRGRIQLGSTRYRVGSDFADRGWFEVDGREIASFSSEVSWREHGAVYHETTDTECRNHPAVPTEDRTEGNLVEPGEFSRLDFHEACWTYLNLPVNEALESPSPLILSLAVLDSRVGQRRLMRLDREGMHPLPGFLLELRCDSLRQGPHTSS